MSVRPEVQRFVESGPLPGEDAPLEEIQKRERELLAIDLPASNEEARLLVNLFGPDLDFAPRVSGRSPAQRSF